MRGFGPIVEATQTTEFNFGRLHADVRRFGRAYRHGGIGAGDIVLVLVLLPHGRPCTPPFSAAMAVGAVPNMMRCYLGKLDRSNFGARFLGGSGL